MPRPASSDARGPVPAAPPSLAAGAESPLADDRPASPVGGGGRARRVLAAAAGPALIVAAVLAVQHAFAFGGMLTNQHPDILAMWLPTHCFLGASLQAGHVPAWNPDILGGAPFAADPQSGWMYLPAMLLSWALPCGTATRWFIVVQPIIAGLGMYAFLRSERLSRPAATTGGLVMALLVGGSYLGVQLPFAGAIAWTTVLLAAASRFLRTERGWPARLGWLLAVAVAWGQIASAHLSNGLVVGTFALAVYLVAAMVPMVRSGSLRGRQAAVLVGLLVVALPLVNLAVLLPRLVYVPGTTSSLGYTEEARRAAELLGKPPPPTPIGATSGGSWPLTLIDPIGGYAGAIALAFALGGWRRSKALFFGFGGLAAACYLLSLEPVAQALSHVLAGTTIGDFYLHVPSRFSDGVVLAVPVLVGLGLQAFRDAATWRERLWVVAPGVLVWWVLAPAIGILHNAVWLPVLAAAIGIAIVVPAVRRPALLVGLPAVVAVELVVNGLLGQAPSESLHGQIEIPAAELGIPPLRRPEVVTADYLRPDAIVGSIRSGPPGRYATIPPTKDHRGLIPYQEEPFWPFLGNQRGVLFDLTSPDGVNPVQNVRHWTFVRATQRGHIYYNASFYRQLSPLARDLLGVNGVVAPATPGCKPKLVGGPALQVAREGLAILCRPDTAVPAASLVGSWVVASSEADALARVTAEGFDPGSTVVLERDPSVGPSPAVPATGTVRQLSAGPQEAEFDVRSSGPAMLLVRTTFDGGWHATVDGESAPVLAGDFVDQAVAVPAGHHLVRLAYDDPWVGRGMLGSGLVLLGVGACAVALEVRRRPRGAGPGRPAEHGEGTARLP